MSGEQLEVIVKSIQAQTPDIQQFDLVSPDGRALPAFTAGSHLDVHLGNDLVRQYSLCNPPDETHRYVIGVLKDPASRGGSVWMHENAACGTRLTISVPKNHFPLAVAARHSILIAGGIGVTPLLCMAEQLSKTGQSFEMHYCTRSRGRTAFLDRIRSSSYSQAVHFHWDDEPDQGSLDLHTITRDLAPDVHVYFCGPQGFMDWILATLKTGNWPDAQVHYEFFSRELEKHDNDAGFEVELAKSGKIVFVGKDETVIQALATAGVDVDVSCEQGVCGTCLTRVLEGQPDHRDSYLTPSEQAANDQFTPCCSRSKTSRLVLDL